jgi:predicted nucleic acid-binding protein
MALAWLFERQQPLDAEHADRVLLAVADSEVLVPALWHLEIANALLMAERRGVTTEAQTLDYLNRLSQLPIITDETSPQLRQDAIMALARGHALTAYDATYLDLALRYAAPLATFDRQLARAMNEVGGGLV